MKQISFGNDKQKVTMVSSEREMLRQEEEAKLGERTPFDSSRQAAYEDSVTPEREWEHEEDS